MNFPIHSVTVQYQLDPDYPLMTASVKYHVIEMETEIIFPTGDRQKFKNWDVRGVRERYFIEDILQYPEEGRQKEPCENGVRPSDVARFCERLSQQYRYEALFMVDFPQPAKPAKGRKFPYQEVARLWHEGKSISEIATAIGYIDTGRKDKDAYHTMRTFLWKMHTKGYLDAEGNRVKLPYRAKAAAAKSS